MTESSIATVSIHFKRAEMSELIYQINPALRIQVFDDAATATRWLYELDDGDGGVQRLVLSEKFHRLLSLFAKPRRLDWSEGELNAEGWQECDRQTLRTLVGEQCLHTKLVVALGGEGHVDHSAPAQAKRPGYMSLMLPLLGPAVVNRLAGQLQRLFAPKTMISGGLIIAVALFSLMRALSEQGRFAAVSSSDVLMAVGLGVVGVVLHELGHAAAAWRSGARSVSIGVGWYVCFPVAYADLSETWRMSRRERALIDVAGVYMQGLWLSALMVWHAATDQAVLLVAALSGAISILWNMNPLLRMDGYWLASDLLGVANLRATAQSSLARAWSRMRGRRDQREPALFGSRTAAALLVYGVLSTTFFCWMIVAAASHFGEAAIDSLPAYASRLWTSDWSRMTVADGWVVVGGFLWQLFMLLVMGRFLQITLSRWWRQLSGPKQPAGA
jgi:putative peptide zinc metalloprotease protein